jgi:hypothetical protein
MAPHTVFDNTLSPPPVFRVPTLPPGMEVSTVQSPTQSQLPLEPEVQSVIVPEPSLPLSHERPGMAMIKYQEEKEK